MREPASGEQGDTLVESRDDNRNKQPAVSPVGDLATTSGKSGSGYDESGLEEDDSEEDDPGDESLDDTDADEVEEAEYSLVPSPFEITQNVIYNPPHISPRMRAQDSVLFACLNPFESLNESDWLEIVIRRDAHDDIRLRLDQYGVFDRQLFPDLDGIAKWLRYRKFGIEGVL